MGTIRQDLSTRYKQRVDIHPWRTYPRRQQSFVNESELMDDVVVRLPISRSCGSPSATNQQRIRTRTHVQATEKPPPPCSNDAVEAVTPSTRNATGNMYLT